MQHRKDIDGLRAIAVLAVVLFHLGVSDRISGGFVGVDVFFVISGYLITGVLQGEVGSGRLSIAEFYNRRVRRIFPALFVVYLFCLIASVIVLFPDQAKGVGWDVLWSLGFLSNVAFSKAGGYFNQSSRVAPLLHTWSLSVEEQFYIVLPLLLLSMARLQRWLRIGILAALAVLSFAAAEWALGVDARHAFYLVQYRAWELLVGSLLALGALPRVSERWLSEALGLLGLCLIFWAIFKIDGNTPFPGYWALPPCLGALAILHSGANTETLTARLLSLPPLRWVGLVSYSLYLWHWPLIALYNARHVELTNGARIAISFIALLASVVSYRYVERPFRVKPYRRSAQATLIIAASAMASVAVLALAVPLAAARLHPPDEVAKTAIKYLDYEADVGAATCFLSSGFDDARLFRKDVCLKLVPGRRSILIMGDSHAAHFVAAFKALHADQTVLQATSSGCEALHGGPGAKRCLKLFAYVFDEFLVESHVDTIVLAGRWPRSTLPQLQGTIEYLKPLVGRVVVLGPVVEYDRPFPELLAQSISSHDPSLIAQHLVPAQRKTDRLFAEQLAISGASYFSVYEATCPQGECTLWAAPGVPMQYDAHHLTLEGAELVLNRLGPTLLR
jgi:peptidoglycan/LPS O-acetylase OafA/YrhL